MKELRADKGTTGGRWAAAIVYTLLIFTFLPIFPNLWGPVSKQFPALTGGITYAFLALLAILITGVLCWKRRGPGFYVWTIAVCLGYGFLILHICKYPAERFHLLEYGVLVILVYRAFAPRVKTARIYLFVILYTFAVGLADELIQALLPNRVYDTRDIAINWAASLLATGLIAGVSWGKHGMTGKEEDHNESKD